MDAVIYFVFLDIVIGFARQWHFLATLIAMELVLIGGEVWSVKQTGRTLSQHIRAWLKVSQEKILKYLVVLAVGGIGVFLLAHFIGK